MEKTGLKMNWIKSRLSEKSTQIAITTLIAALLSGHVSEELRNAIMALGLALVGVTKDGTN